MINVVSYLISTSNHNSVPRPLDRASVVSYLISTSNHNCGTCRTEHRKLCHILFLHQTTTALLLYHAHTCCVISYFYIKPQPSVAAEWLTVSCVISYFYIKPQLQRVARLGNARCVISYFYIKPQLLIFVQFHWFVVSYLISTSNHNPRLISNIGVYVVSYLISTSNHNVMIITYLMSNN